MNPKQKAEELVAKFQQVEVSAMYRDDDNDVCIVSDKMYTIPAIECAIIAVEEIIDINALRYSSAKMFWNKVLTELKSMQ